MSNEIEGAMPPLPSEVREAINQFGNACAFGPTSNSQQAAENLRHVISAYAAPLVARVAELHADAERYRWIKERLLGADFAWGDPSTSVWVFETDAPISADLDASIDAAIAAKD